MLVPPRAVTVISYVPGLNPAEITAPVMELSFTTAEIASVLVPNLTEVTVLLPTPPKNPVPEIFIVAAVPFPPVFVLKLVTVGAGVVTAYLFDDEVTLVPPRAVTVIS